MWAKLKQDLGSGKALLQFGLLSALGQGFGVVTPFVLADLLGSDRLGTYYLIRSALFLFVAFLLTWMQIPFVVFASQERRQTGRINTSFSLQCVFRMASVMAVSAAILVGRTTVAQFARIPPDGVIFILLAFAGLTLKSTVGDLLLAMDQRLKNALAEFVFGLACLVGVVALYLGNRLTEQTVFLVYPVSGLVVTVVFGGTLDYRLLRPFVLDKRQILEMIAFSKWLFIGTVGAYFIGWQDTFVLKYFTSTQIISKADIGVYNLGCEVFRGLIMLTFVMYTYFLPFVSEHIVEPHRIQHYLSHKRPRVILLGLLVLAVCFVAAPHGFVLLKGPMYAASASILRILLVGAALAMYNVFYEPILHAIKRPYVNPTVTVVQALLHLGLDLILVPKMGIQGAAVALCAGYAARVLIYEVYFRTRVRPLLGLGGSQP